MTEIERTNWARNYFSNNANIRKTANIIEQSYKRIRSTMLIKEICSNFNACSNACNNILLAKDIVDIQTADYAQNMLYECQNTASQCLEKVFKSEIIKADRKPLKDKKYDLLLLRNIITNCSCAQFPICSQYINNINLAIEQLDLSGNFSLVEYFGFETPRLNTSPNNAFSNSNQYSASANTYVTPNSTKKSYGSLIGLIVTLVLVFSVGIAIVYGLMFSTVSTTPKSASTNSYKNTVSNYTRPNTNSSRSSSSSSTQSKTNTYDLNDPFTIDTFRVSVKSYEFVDKISTSAYTAFTPDEGNVYCVVYMSVYNESNSANTFNNSFSFTPSNVNIIYADSYTYSATNLLGYDDDLHDTFLNPLTKKEGIIAFEVPERVETDSNASLEVQIKEDDETAKIKLR